MGWRMNFEIDGLGSNKINHYRLGSEFDQIELETNLKLAHWNAVLAFEFKEFIIKIASSHVRISNEYLCHSSNIA